MKDMNDIERKVLKKYHLSLVETIEPFELRPFLYSKDVLPIPTFLDDDRVRTRRAEKFLEHIVENCSFSLFLESLSKDCAYDFLAEKLQRELDNISKGTTNSRYVPHEIKESLFTPDRAKAIWFRHELKRHSMTGNTKAFLERSKTVIDSWNAIPKQKRCHEDNQELANMYFMVLDATMERRRVIYDKTLYKDDELFDKMKDVSLYTSSATLPTAMYLARYGSALLMAGKPVEDALSYVEQAKQRLQTLPACRESGVVLYIEYNMLLSERYEINPTVKMKSMLLEIGRNSIDHFCREQETVGKDFRRMVLIKQALLLLGIGLFLNDVDCVSVTDADKGQAKTILQEIRKEENWERMEHRWHVAYYVAKSKLLRLEGQSEKALDKMQKASKYAREGKFKKELGNINKSLVFQSEKRPWKYRHALLLLSFIILLIAVVYQKSFVYHENTYSVQYCGVELNHDYSAISCHHRHTRSESSYGQQLSNKVCVAWNHSISDITTT